MPQYPNAYTVKSPYILVDDSYSSIRYNGTWNMTDKTALPSIQLEQSTPMFNTLHVLQTASGSLSYDFNGTSISVFARSLSDANYTSDCFLDGVPLGGDTAVESTIGEGRPICAATALNATVVHTISVFVSVRPQEKLGPISGFAFDYMLIQPVPGVSVWDSGNNDLFLSMIDAPITQNTTTPVPSFGIDVEEGQLGNFSSSWTYDSSLGFHTTTAGSQFNITFTGASLWWYGFANSSDTYGQSSIGEYSVDSSAPRPFSVPSVLLSSTPLQTYFFRTPAIDSAKHHLSILHHGSTSLGLQSLIVQRSSPASLVANSTTESPGTSHTSRHANPGIIAGIIAGCLISLFLVSGGIYVRIWRPWRRRRLMRTEAQDKGVAPEPFPIQTEGAAPLLLPRKARTSGQRLENPLIPSLPAPPSTKWTRTNSSTINSVVTDSSQPQPTNSSTVNIQSVSHPGGNTSHPSMSNITNSTNVSPEEDLREEDSGYRIAPQGNTQAFGIALPPIYSAY